LSDEEAKRGVVTHSSGNHGAAIAYAASLRGIPAKIVMGETATAVKVRNVTRFGAEVIRCAPSLRARQRMCDELVGRYGCLPIPLSDSDEIIAGQGTVALELLEDAGGLDALIAPVGGGGLLCGTAIVSAACSPLTQVHGAEPIAADDAARSLASGRVEPLEAPQTIADGLHATLSERTLAGIRRHVKSVGTASEDGIRLAMKLAAEHLKVVVEPSASVPLACLLEHSLDLSGRRIGIILTGGNVEWRG
jgi:threonine dehydratase